MKVGTVIMRIICVAMRLIEFPVKKLLNITDSKRKKEKDIAVGVGVAVRMITNIVNFHMHYAFSFSSVFFSPHRK